MKNYQLIFLAVILAFSCRKPEIQGETIHERIIENKSSHSIKIKNLAFNEIELEKNENFEKRTISDGENPPIISGYLIPEIDSLEVIFDDTLTVFHGSKLYTMFRDLRRNDLFNFTEKGINGINHYTYTYTFTDADYEEAKTK